MKNLLLLFVILAVTTGSAFAKEVKVSGYTKKDGTKVEGYTKTVKDKDADTVEVKGYTKKDGTDVKGYTRKKVK
ncbi:MAG: hypothetical protein EKK48_29975 [Candidatus Melainabacteria bacterium]|nr:MAG: hypothetical protein EKK48_29975 [Candidatus Melainabacteria bacterium]